MLFLAIGLAGSGLFSCDPGCPPVMETPAGWMHTVFGLAFFVTMTVAPYVAWRTFRRRGEWRSYGPISLGVGILLTVLFLVGPFFGAERVGIWQRTTLLVYLAWAVAVALRLYRSLRSPGEAKESTLNIVSSAR